MKTGLAIAGVVVLAIGGAGYLAVSGFMNQAAWARDTFASGGALLADMSGQGGATKLASRLNLTQDQRSQIKTIMAEERPAVAPLVRDLKSTWMGVQASTNTGSADPQALRSQILGEKPVLVDLIVQGVKTKATIYNTVLRPDQQQRAQSMMSDIGPRMDERIDRIPTMADRFVSLASWKLNLTDDQQQQIRTLIDGAVQKDMPLIKQFAKERKALADATAGGKYDEPTVTALAQAPAATATELAADAAVTKNSVFAVLTPDQRERIIALQAKRRARREEGI